MTDDEKDNEHVKLAANWLNTLATAVMTIGALAPAGNWIFGILPPNTDSSLVLGVFACCMGAGALLHLTGHLLLGALK